MSVPSPIDTLIHARWVVPVEPGGLVLNHHTIALQDGLIAALLPTAEARTRYTARRDVSLPDHVVIPGLINLHTHSAMTLMRGLADDLPLMDWLQKHIWPVETRHVSREFVRDGTLLACGEMLQGGITCFNDMYFFPEATAEAVVSAGLRAAIGIILIDLPTAYASDADDYLNKGLATRDTYRDHPRLRFCMAPHAPYTVSDKNLGKMLTYAEQLDVPIHIHLHETEEEIRTSTAQHGLRPIQRLRNLGLIGPNLIAVHMVHLNDEEIRLMADQGCNTVHCPTSNLKLASGLAPIASLLENGVNVGLGTDGAASNNRLDLFEEMRLAALLAKVQSGRADVLPAHQALRMATLNGAKALGWEHAIGSIEPGKAADLAAVDLSGLETSPCYDPVSHLVYAAGREHVTHVWVNGKLLVDDRQLTTLNLPELTAKAMAWQTRIATTG